MKKTIIMTLAYAATASLALAQTSTTTTQTTTQDPVVSQSETTTTTTTSADGTVTTFTPGQTLVVRQVGVTDPITYTLGKTVEFFDRAGKSIEASMIRPGVPVHVYYDTAGNTRTVTKIIVDQK